VKAAREKERSLEKERLAREEYERELRLEEERKHHE
jgi:hypothetical protein